VLGVVEVTEVVRGTRREDVVDDGPKVMSEGEVLLERLADCLEESNSLGGTRRRTGGEGSGLVEEDEKGKAGLAGRRGNEFGELHVAGERNLVAVFVDVGEGGGSGVEGEALLDLLDEGGPGRLACGGNGKEASFVAEGELEVEGGHGRRKGRRGEWWKGRREARASVFCFSSTLLRRVAFA
jgi:hypothetical protein